MQSDRELLELAAMAAGIDSDETGPFVWGLEIHDFGGEVPERREIKVNWNPLDDIEQAFRLAIALNIGIRPRILGMGTPTALAVAHGISGDGMGVFFQCQHNGDAIRATCRAITEAAAGIGPQPHPKQHNDGGAVYE